MTRTSILDSQLGIATIRRADPLTQEPMPRSRTLAMNTLTTTSMEATYTPTNIQTVLEAAICPETGDGEMLVPTVFSTNLHNCKKNLEESEQIEIQNFLKKDLQPLLENESLLRMYVALMIEG